MSLAAAVIKALVEAEAGAFLRQEQAPVPPVAHGQLDGGIAKQLGAGNILHVDAGLAAL